jgi:hypothetical protein
MHGIRALWAIAFLIGGVGCGAEPAAEPGKKSALGEGCVKSADCSGDLVCVGGACSAPGGAVDATPPDAGDTDAVGTDAAVQDLSQQDAAQADGADAADAGTDAAVDTCDATCPIGACVNLCGQPCPGACTDKNACTTGDVCKDGKCTGQALACDDKNPCTDDTCDPDTGCKVTPNAAVCDDDNPCTVGDVCAASSCKAGAAKSCPSNDSCVVGKCSITGGGKCMFSDAPDGAVCDDGTACTTGDACKTGTCSGQKLDCDDKNPCTADVCDSKSGCVHQDITAACDDGNGCTVGDACKAGACAPGAAKSCDDSAPCTKDSCSPKTGQCLNAPESLDGTSCDADGSKCTIADACNAGVCIPGKKANCDDGNICTADSCDIKAGCENAPTTGPCNADDSACTADMCASGKCAAGQGKACTDINACTADVCDPKTGQCSYTGLPDGTVCDPGAAAGCKPVACKVQTCVPATPPNCDDGNDCTLDSCTETPCAPGEAGCTPKAVCVHQPAAGSCDADGSVCTVGDACSGGACVAGKVNSCSDNNPCTDDSCDKKAGCSNVVNTASCSDGDACTENDVCAAGTCTGIPFKCDPCANYGGTAMTLTTDHVVVCKGSLASDEILKVVLPGAWSACSKGGMIKWAPTKTIYDFSNQFEKLWLKDACSDLGMTGRLRYSGSGYLNSSSSYDCMTYGYSTATRLLVCHD